MFSKFISSTAVVLALLSQVHAHAAIAPALGVAGTPVRGNVQRPSNANPCGNENIANTINTSTAVAANSAGQFTTTVTNFNGGADGSRKVTAKVDASGKGTNFVAATVTTNGDAAPSNVGSQQIVASLPAGTKCTGGSTGNKCLVQFVTTAGFGNCVVVSQGAAASGAAATSANTGAANTGTANTGTAKTGTANTGTAKTGTANTGTAKTGAAANNGAAKKGNGKKGKNGKAKKGNAKNAAGKNANGRQGGSRAARALLAELADIEARAEEGLEIVKRQVSGWLWA